MLIIAFCLPGTIILDIVAGFLFGNIGGVILVVFSYSMGSICNFFVVRYFLKSLLKNRFTKFRSLIHGRGKYGLMLNLISLRLIAIIPFWIVNIVAAICNVRFSTFFISTFIGIIPTAIVYVALGSGMYHVTTTSHAPILELLLNPKILVPLLFMAILLVLPNFFMKTQSKKVDYPTAK